MAKIVAGQAVEVVTTQVGVFFARVTPDLAQLWLNGARAPNRVPRRVAASRYERIMARGAWKVTHQGIAFDELGRLQDGQHRLLAIVQSGAEQIMLVAVNVPVDSFDAMDMGAKRSIAEALSKGKHYVAVAQALCGWSLNGSTKVHLSAQEVASVLEEYEDACGFAVDNIMAPRARRLSTAPVAAQVARALLAGEDRERLRDFCRVFLSGIPDDASDDRAALRASKMILAVDGNSPSFPTLRKLQRAIQAFCKREAIEKLYDTGDVYPAPTVPVPAVGWPSAAAV